jgi:nucleotide-binding universal stress UspA family protein
MEGNGMNTNVRRSRNILIAVDESDNAKRAVTYVQDLLSGLQGFHIIITTIIPRPPEDYFLTEKEKNDWIERQNTAAQKILAEYRQIFIQAGFCEEDVVSHLVMKECSSLAECILDEQKKLACGTVVIGRRGISRKEEFMFGSTSNKILHTAKDCSVWVIE